VALTGNLMLKPVVWGFNKRLGLHKQAGAVTEACGLTGGLKLSRRLGALTGGQELKPVARCFNKRLGLHKQAGAVTEAWRLNRRPGA